MTPKQIKEQEVEDSLQRERDERAKRAPRDKGSRVAILGGSSGLMRTARAFCEGTDNAEYVRGQAELIIDSTVGLDMDDRDDLMEWLSRPVADG